MPCPHSLTSQVCTVCGAVQHCAHCPRPAPGCCYWPGSESCGHHESPPPPSLLSSHPRPCSDMLTAMIWLHCDYDMIIWRDYDMRYEIWLHCPSVRHCGSVVSALLSAVHHITQMLPAISTVHHPHPPLHCAGHVHSRVECQSFATFRVFSPLHVIYINIDINTRNNI